MLKGEQNKRIFNFIFWAFTLLIVAYRLYWIFSAPFPLSSDAYFYLQEIKHRAATGRGYYVGFSPLLWLMGTLGWLTPFSDHMIFNCTVTGTLLMMTAAIWLLFKRSTQSWLAPGLIFILWASDLVFFRQYAFLKQSFALSFLYLAVCAMEYGWQKKNKAPLVIAVFSLIVAALSHIFGSFLGAILTLAYTWKRSKVLATSLFVCAAIPAVLYLMHNPKPVFAVSADKLLPTWASACTFTSCSPVEWVEFMIFFLASIILFGYSIYKRGQPVVLVCSLVCLLCYLPIWTDSGHMSYRLALTTVWIVPLALTVSVLQAEARWRYLVAGICVVSLISKFTLPDREYTGPAMPVELISNNIERLQEWIPKDSLIIAPHGLQFRLTYFLDRRSSRHRPTKTRFSNIYRLSNQSSGKRRCTEISSQLQIAGGKRCIRLNKHWTIHKIASS